MVLLWAWSLGSHLAVTLAALFLSGASFALTLTFVIVGCAEPKKAAKDPKDLALGQPKPPASETPRTASEKKPKQPATPNPPSSAADAAVDKTQQPTSNADAKANQATASVKTGLPASANTGKTKTEDTFAGRQPEYKDAKAADKVREHGPVPKNEKGYATMDDIGGSNFESVPTSHA